jgi:hypothetical protein
VTADESRRKMWETYWRPEIEAAKALNDEAEAAFENCPRWRRRRLKKIRSIRTDRRMRLLSITQTAGDSLQFTLGDPLYREYRALVYGDPQ